MNQEFTCIVCPNSCDIRAEVAPDGTITEICGQLCPRGAEYVRQELTDPRRNIASSVSVRGGSLPLVSVRLTAPVPKASIFAVMGEINRISLAAPVKIGQVLIPNVLGLGVNVIATKNVEKA